jgi:hypothetical protein
MTNWLKIVDAAASAVRICTGIAFHSSKGCSSIEGMRSGEWARSGIPITSGKDGSPSQASPAAQPVRMNSWKSVVWDIHGLTPDSK